MTEVTGTGPGSETSSALLSHAMGASTSSDDAIAVPTALDERILDATLRCVARWGLSKTTLDDIAREAGCSRATIYRALPGGKQALLVAAGHREVGRVLRDLDARLVECTTLRDVLVTLVHEGASCAAGSEALVYLVEHEPEVILPHVSFDGLEPLLHRVAEFALPHLSRFLDRDAAWRTGEWMARLVASYVFGDEPTLDLTDRRRAEHVIDTYVLPGLVRSVPPVVPMPAAAAGA